ncbi:hypothetical protein [uncultured Shewanella sp.]|uniref:hypothetical protein n=1 Tax=uncultured Shewanella sp. TaxID=173975 RepID=UPI002634E48E|nr:hypothetical protein [uncultured Shewanella sp.]
MLNFFTFNRFSHLPWSSPFYRLSHIHLIQLIQAIKISQRLMNITLMMLFTAISLLSWPSYAAKTIFKEQHAPSHWQLNKDVQIKKGTRLIVDKNSDVYVGDNVTLTIDEKAQLIIHENSQFLLGKNAKIMVRGKLSSQGSEEAPVRFLSNQTSPEKGDWQGIEAFLWGPTLEVNLSHTHISHAKVGLNIIAKYGSQSQRISVQHGLFSHNHIGISYSDRTSNNIYGHLSIHYNQFIDNTLHFKTRHNHPLGSKTIIDARHNWWGSDELDEITAKIDDSILVKNKNNKKIINKGVKVNYSEYLLSKNKATYAKAIFTQLPAVIQDEAKVIADTNSIKGQKSVLSAGSQLIIQAGVTLRILNDSDFIVKEGARIILEDDAQLIIDGHWQLAPGSEILSGKNADIRINGQLTSLGTKEKPIRFDSSLPNKSSWSGINVSIYSQTAALTLKHTKIRHALTGLYISHKSSITSPAIDIKESEFSHNLIGIHYFITNHKSKNTSVVIQHNEFIDNQINLKATGRNNTSNSKFIIDARHNWWGSNQLSEIAAKIYDFQQDNQHGLKVNYGQYLTQPRSQADTHHFMTQLPTELKQNGEYVLQGEYHVLGDTQFTDGQVVKLTSKSQLIVKANSLLSIMADSEFLLESGAKIILEDNARLIVHGRWQLAEGVQVIAGQQAGIYVYGQLLAKGQEDDLISFSSSFPDASANSWKGITGYPNAHIELEYVSIAHATHGLYGYIHEKDKGIYINVNHSHFFDNKHGVRVFESGHSENTQIQLTYNAFGNNEFHVYTSGNQKGKVKSIIDARYNWWNTAIISDIASKIYDISHDSSALKVNYGQYRYSLNVKDIAKNTIVSTWPEALLINNEYRLKGQYTLIGDTQVQTGEKVRLTAGSQLTIKAGAKLSVATLGEFIIEKGAKVILEDGAYVMVYGRWELSEDVKVIAGNKAGINVHGQLIAQGSQADVISFSSELDNNNSATHQWQGINTYAGSVIKLKYVNISQAKHGLYAYINEKDTGIDIDVSYSRFSNNAIAFYVKEFDRSDNTHIKLNYNAFVSNQFHVYTSATNQYQLKTIIDARYNWWNTAIISEIASKIRDDRQDQSALKVNYGQYRYSLDVKDIAKNTIISAWPESLLVEDEYRLNGQYELIGHTQVQANKRLRLTSGSQLTIKAGTKLTIEALGQFIVEEGATLVIEDNAHISVHGLWHLAAGVKVNTGQKAAIYVYGQLIAKGQENNKISFSSYIADAGPNTWYGIIAYAGSTITLHHVHIYHAKYGVYGHLNTQNNKLNIDIRYSTFKHNFYGVRLYEYYAAEILATLHYNQFIDNEFHVYTTRTQSSASNNIIDARYNWWNSANAEAFSKKIYDIGKNPNALKVNYGQYRRSVAFDDIATDGIVAHWPSALIKKEEIVLNGDFNLIGNIDINEQQVVRVTSGSHITLNAGVQLSVYKGGQWIVEEGATVTINESAAIIVYGNWQINAGVKVYSGSNAKIEVYGTLAGLGTKDNEIVFGSLLNSSLSDTDSALLEDGNWQGITGYSGANIQLVYTQIRDAKYGLFGHINTSEAVNFDVRYSRFINNINGVRIYETVPNTSSKLVLHYNQYINNLFNIYGYGTGLDSRLVIDARFNWWNSTNINKIKAKIYDIEHSNKGLRINYTQRLLSQDPKDVDFSYQNTAIAQDVQVAKRIRIGGNTSIASGHSMTLGAGANMTLDAKAHLIIHGDLILDEDAQFIAHEGAKITVTGRIIAKGKELIIPKTLSVDLQAGSYFLASPNTQVHIHGHFNSLGHVDNPVTIGLNNTSDNKLLWQGLLAHDMSQVNLTYTTLSDARVGIYTEGSSQVNIKHSVLKNNIRAVHLHYNKPIKKAGFSAHYNRFENNSEYNIYAAQTHPNYFTGQIPVEYNWWGSQDPAVVNQAFYDKGRDSVLGLWLNFSHIWLNAAGENVLQSAVAGPILAEDLLGKSVRIIGYSELNQDVSVSKNHDLIIAPYATLVANADILLEENAQLIVKHYGELILPAEHTLTLAEMTALKLGVEAKITLYGKLLVQASLSKPSVLRGAQVGDPLICP